ncbi:hypothetical protein TL16_g09057 [Triparma laevis f. inornata]|uniref:Glycosyltransferase family 2 protein n=2 Tax=Triparma laevis TaxID=1534972 RepID=A0A9W7FHF1_9STRA|nr:hypothetical protein TL16_g09057 [Triparma laevis f. inornata]GMI12086.1 hypothetical protein TrLO_g2633 [Triparma laevis f. longispina]
MIVLPILLSLLPPLTSSLDPPNPIDTTFTIQTTDSSTITITCIHNQSPHHCATTVCSEYSLGETIEGAGCVEILSDEISARRESKSVGGGLPLIIGNDYDDARYIRLYQSHEDNDFSFTRFCSIHSVDIEACQLLFTQAVAEYDGVLDEPEPSSSPTSLTPNKPFVYISAGVADHLTFNFDQTQFTFRTHHSPPEVASRICAQISQTQQHCDTAEIQNLIVGAIETELNKPSNAGLLELTKNVHIGSVNEWVNMKPHSVNLSRVRVRASQDINQVMATFCSYERCPDRINTVAVLADAIKSDDPEVEIDRSKYRKAHEPRLVVSLTSLPSRLDHLTQTLNHMLRQSKLPDLIIINLPKFSKREQKPYIIPEHVHAYISSLPSPHKSLIFLNICSNDFGPATKLIPTLEIETDPTTMIVTIDDDVYYPSFYLESLYNVSVRMPDYAVGFKGYVIPENGNTEHSNYTYIESSSSNHKEVHVLGGFLGVAYRRGMFCEERIKDYSWYSEGSFFVDDDWISGALGWGGIRKYVVGGEGECTEMLLVFFLLLLRCF